MTMTSVNLTFKLHVSISRENLRISKQFLQPIINNYLLNVEH